MKLNDTIGIPLGMIMGLGVMTVIMAQRGALNYAWFIGAGIMITASVVMWMVVNRITMESLRRRHKKINNKGPVKRIPVFRQNSTNKRGI